MVVEMKKNYHIILSSNSPRRKELLEGLDLDFEVRVLQGVSESYPSDLPVMDIAGYIAAEKAEAYKGELEENNLVITADTVVVLGDKVLGKPKDLGEAREMLRMLSGHTHQVVTGVCLTTSDKQRSFSVVTDPLDKAGAYGIQEWIGYIGVTSINGSYFNVMGLPVQRIYDELCDF